MDFVIHYRVEDGGEEAALAFARRLFAHFDIAIDSLALIPVADEELDVYLDGQLVHSQSQTGRPPRLVDVFAALGQHT
ncbi:MAG TPA: Rdx family protein [Chloroflexota bacterium]|nr:Rdx family protein [Chloroflexota bacterium]